MSFRRAVITCLASIVVIAACADPQQLDDALNLGSGGSSDSAGGAPGAGGDSDTGGTPSGSGTGGTPFGSGGAINGSGGNFTSGGAPATGMGGGSGGKVSQGGAGAGGGPGTGGTVPVDAGNGIGGMSSDSGIATDGGNACPNGQKRCQGSMACVVPIPSNGCDLGEACTPCAGAPANGYTRCTSDACDFDCLSGFTRSSDGMSCVSGNGSGGTTGAGGRGGGRGGRNGTGGSGTGGTGAGGSPTQCSVNSCPDCNNILEAPCCRNNGSCGCALLGIVLCN
ncbi:MAG TPA: hypothetical protein VH062_24715 [Polyangiaceae bacterium]|jgi:hypothetical protein|nr:hypothetical protein [Polyangiaceae bacterium]